MPSGTRCHIILKLTKSIVELLRLNDEEFNRLRVHSIPIKEDSMFLLRLFLEENRDQNGLTLPLAFITLEHLFGKTSLEFDHWKGSFNFPLLLSVKKEKKNFPYLFRVFDHRGCLSFSFYRVLENGIDEYNTFICREPFKVEFSREEINYFLSYFYGYLKGFSQYISNLPREVFIKTIDSNHIIYGYQNGEFFEEQIESEEAYREAITLFEQNHYSLIKANQSEEIQDLLRNIKG